LAEDNAVNQEVAVNMLTLMDCEVEVAGSGKAAVELFEKSDHDVVLMDVHMPEMDGFDAARRIREIEVEKGISSGIVIVALTANAMAGDRERCLAAGMNDYLSKPFVRKDLEKVFNNWFPAKSYSLATNGESSTSPPQGGIPETTQESASEEGEDVVEGIESAEQHSDSPTEIADSSIDEAALNNIRSLQREGQPSILDKVINIYFETSPGLIKSIHESLGGGVEASEDVQRAAHTLKSASANLGALELADVCKQLEFAAKEKRLSDFSPLLDQIEDLYPRVCEALSGFLTERAA
jgi:CheY-like chemotaxis protein